MNQEQRLASQVQPQEVIEKADSFLLSQALAKPALEARFRAGKCGAEFAVRSAREVVAVTVSA
jgi:hypothetical protein